MPPEPSCVRDRSPRKSNSTRTRTFYPETTHEPESNYVITHLHFSHWWQGLSAGQLAEIYLLENGLGCLAALPRSTARVPVVCPRWLQHVQPVPFILIPRSNDLRWSERSDWVVEGVGVKIEGESGWEGFAWDFNIEILIKFIGLVSSIVHEVASVGYFAVECHANVFVNVEDASMGAGD